jgi:hypothetical protein
MTTRDDADGARNAGAWALAVELYAKAANEAPARDLAAECLALRGLALLATGEPRGWLDFEQRFSAPGRDLHAFPRDDLYWCGDPTSSLLIWAEGGRGNTIQFMRYVNAVAARFVLPIVLAVHREMVELVRDHLVSGDVDVIAVDAAVLAKHGEEHCSILSLPAIFAFKAWPDPLVPPLARAPRRRLPLRIGLNWAGNPSYWDDARRSFAAYPFGPLEDLIPKVLLSELQASPAVMASPATLGEDFARETMAELAGLDLVVTTDTAMAHLAGALGIPTWLLLHDACNWRWAPQGPATVGPLRYESVRIFRAPTTGPDLVANVRSALVAELAR